MATPTTTGKFRKQSLGENLNTWGLSGGLNGNWDAADDALFGVEVLSLTGNKTLTTVNYAADNEVAPRIHRIADGGLSAAPTLTIPALANWWIVQNTTNYEVTYDNGSNSVSVSANRSAVVLTDGTNVYSVSFFASADQTYPGGLSYTFSTTTTGSDPGSGNLRLDNATQTSATGIYIDDEDANGADVSAWLLTWDDSASTPAGYIVLRSIATPANFHIYSITSLADNSGYMDFTVAHVDGNGTLSNGDAITVTPILVGAKGDTGAIGPAGSATTAGEPSDADDAVPLGSAWYMAACFGR